MRGNNKTKRHRSITRALLLWYARNGRELPWRNTGNPYRILISEIMLQQTQVQRVLLKYPEFLRRFPTMRSLFRASRKEIVTAWKGMGYNNRAVRLHQLARVVMVQHKGKIPSTYEELMALPGIGRYTANALLSSAFKQDLPVVDVNVQRFYSRVFWKMTFSSQLKPLEVIWLFAETMVPHGRTYQWNQALMDIGASICTARNPQCPECPVAKYCASAGNIRLDRGGQSRREPSFHGLPNRVYRGRIVDLLRTNQSHHRIRADILARRVAPYYSNRDRAWLFGILDGLRRDGLITVRGNGTARTRWVSLA